MRDALAVFLMIRPARSQTVFVATTGDDATADGSRARPFHTLAAACEKTPAGAKTIQIGDGVFPETRTCRVPAGVSVAGAGIDKTKLQWSTTQELETNPHTIAADKFLIQVRISNGASIGGFSIDGHVDDTTRAHAGILLHRVKHAVVHDISATSFNFCAIYLSDAADSEIRNCTVDDSGHPDKSSCSGGIIVGEMTDCAVHDCLIREHRGAYGIKGWRFVWGDQDPPGGVDLRMPLVHCGFFNNDIRVRQQGGWGNGQPNMAMELWDCRPTDCQIYNNRFNECLSLTGEGRGKKTYRVHHNKFVEEPGYSYAMEIATHDVEVDHNYFTNGDYPLASFGGRIDDLNVHDNVFDHIESVAVLNFSGGLRDLRFEHNTVVSKEPLPILAVGGESDHLLIAGNLFDKEGAAMTGPMVSLAAGDPKKGPAVIKAGTIHVQDNAFVNWNPTGDAPMTAGDAPAFAGTGGRESLGFYQLAEGNPLAKTGVRAEPRAPR
jgi:hypothetical protein